MNTEQRVIWKSFFLPIKQKNLSKTQCFKHFNMNYSRHILHGMRQKIHEKSKTR